jgi:hypothetical protein
MTDKHDYDKPIEPISCADCEALLQDFMENTLDWRDRERMDAHRLDCEKCDALVTDLVGIQREAAKLLHNDLSPSRDLWEGIEKRIDAASVVEFPRTPLPGEVSAVGFEVGSTGRSAVAVASQPAPLDSRPNARPSALGPRLKYFAAASLLVAATAGITWSVASRNAVPLDVPAESASTPRVQEGISDARAVSRTSMQAAYDKEIADLRKIVDENKAELDSATAAVLERNLKVIDDAIAECKAALTASPGSAFLLDRLNDAYSTKLRTLRAVAVAPVSGDGE